MKKPLIAARNFANYCLRVKIAPSAMADIIDAVEKSVKAANRNCLPTTHLRLTESADKAARLAGFSLDWSPGLYPRLVCKHQDGSTYHEFIPFDDV
jgi:hypothetical protein